MSFKWNIPPGKWTIESLRAEVLDQVFYTVNSSADKLAVEAEQWMKDNAPWKDVEVRRRSQRAKTVRLRPGQDPYEIVFPAGNARKHLRVYVERESQEQLRLNKATNREAARRDAIALAELNKKRGYRQQVPLSRLPKEMRAERAPKYNHPLARIIFTHGSRQRVPYAVWLELAHQGRFSIIDKATYYWGAKIMTRLKQARVTPVGDPVPHRYEQLSEKENPWSY